MGLGPKLGRKMAEKQKLNLCFYYFWVVNIAVWMVKMTSARRRHWQNYLGSRTRPGSWWTRSGGSRTPSKVKQLMFLVAAKPLEKMVILVFLFCCVGSVVGRSLPQDPVKRARLETWCRTQLKLAP